MVAKNKTIVIVHLKRQAMKINSCHNDWQCTLHGPERSVLTVRNAGKIRVWLLNTTKVIDMKLVKNNVMCVHRWSTKLENVNNQNNVKKVKYIESYLDALLLVEPSSSCFLFLFFIIIYLETLNWWPYVLVFTIES